MALIPQMKLKRPILGVIWLGLSGVIADGAVIVNSHVRMEELRWRAEGENQGWGITQSLIMQVWADGSLSLSLSLSFLSHPSLSLSLILFSPFIYLSFSPFIYLLSLLSQSTAYESQGMSALSRRGMDGCRRTLHVCVGLTSTHVVLISVLGPNEVWECCEHTQGHHGPHVLFRRHFQKLGTLTKT